MENIPVVPVESESSRFQPVATTEDGQKTHVAITIAKDPQAIYRFWRDFQNLPVFLKDVQDIRVLSPERSHWTIRLSSGFLAEWDATITADIVGERIAWRSDPGSDVETHGDIRFENATGQQGTVVRLSMTYHIPGGRLTELVTFFSGEDPETLAMTNLKRLKALLETGEFPTTEGQSSGRENDLRGKSMDLTQH